MAPVSAAHALTAGLSLCATLSLSACGTQTVGGAPTVESAARPGSPTALPSDELGLVRPDTLSPSPPVSSPPASPTPTCPDSGVLLAAEPANAAMGLRAQTVTLTNCGSRVQRLTGYPAVRLLDEEGDPLDVELDLGGRAVTSAAGDPGPKSLTVRPGGSAHFSLMWRNAYDDTRRPPMVGATVAVTPVPGGPEQHVTPDSPYNLGSTGRLGITAWR